MKKPLLVGVSQRVEYFADRGERRDLLDQRMSQWISQLDCIPVPIPNSLSGCVGDNNKLLEQWLLNLDLKAFVLSGGNDIGDAYDRDQTERQILAFSYDNKLPLLGICRGMQMMGLWAGASLMQVSGHARTRHRLHGRLLSEVNSFHNFALSECPAGFDVLATAEDHGIEAISHKTLPWEGWMWHPERESIFSVEHMNRARLILHAGYTS